MIIEIHIHSVFFNKIPNTDKNPKKDRWEVPEGADIRQVLEMLNLTDTPTLLILNGSQGEPTLALNDGDILKIYGVPSGG